MKLLRRQGSKVAPAFSFYNPTCSSFRTTLKLYTTTIKDNNQEAEIINTTISNLRKNLSEGDRGLWQEVWVFEILKDISSNIYSGFSGIFNL